MGPLLTILFDEVVIPEIGRAFRAYMSRNNGQVPTDEELKAELEKNTAKYISEGKAFLARTGGE